MCFFFSSRRRHTRWPRDWSSDVCSSDLRIHLLVGTQRPDAAFLGEGLRDNFDTRVSLGPLSPQGAQMMWEAPYLGVAVPRNARGRGTARLEDESIDEDGKSTRLNYSHVA